VPTQSCATVYTVLAGYYRRFIPEFSKIAKPLTDLLKKDAKFVWEGTQEEAFIKLKDTLCSQPLLQYPDFTKQFIITTDASNYAIGGILSQGPIGKDLPIAYASRLLNPPEKNYSTIEKELLAIVYCTHYFRPYVHGQKFILVTDHKPLIWLHSVKDPTSRLLRWRLKLAEYEYEVIYKAGKTNINADALSRNPVENQSIKIYLYQQENDSDSDTDIIFETEPRKSNIEKITEKPDTTEDEEDQDLNSGNDHADKDNQEEYDSHSDIEEINGNTEQSDSSTTSQNTDAQIYDPDDAQYEPTKPEFIYTRDNLLMRKNNLLIFNTQKGDACDEGARQIINETNKIKFTNNTLGRAKILIINKRKIIALTIKERNGQTTDENIFKECLRSLVDVITELQLRNISMCNGNVAEYTWLEVKKMLREFLTHIEIKIILCNNAIKIPNESQRENIIIENHDSAVGGHKGVTKTYNRIRYNYFWPNMKS